MHVVPAVDVVPAGGFGLTGAVPHELTEGDSSSLDEAQARAEAAGVTAYTRLLRGDPVDEIVAYADTVDADLIVVGSRGHGAVASALLGSVSRGILREARRPGARRARRGGPAGSGACLRFGKAATRAGNSRSRFPARYRWRAAPSGRDSAKKEGQRQAASAATEGENDEEVLRDRRTSLQLSS